MASPSTVLTLGFGVWGTVNDLLTLGYGIGTSPPPPPPPPPPTPTGRRCGTWEVPNRTATWEQPSRSTRWYDDLCSC
jgi:hypothetical protein